MFFFFFIRLFYDFLFVPYFAPEKFPSLWIWLFICLYTGRIVFRYFVTSSFVCIASFCPRIFFFFSSSFVHQYFQVYFFQLYCSPVCGWLFSVFSFCRVLVYFLSLVLFWLVLVVTLFMEGSTLWSRIGLLNYRSLWGNEISLGRIKAEDATCVNVLALHLLIPL